ncbi:hypothetical protein Dimus_024698 [Dionaea muscipula]
MVGGGSPSPVTIPDDIDNVGSSRADLALDSDLAISSVGLTEERRCLGGLGEMVDGLGEDDGVVLVGHSSVLSEKMIDSVMGVSLASSSCSGMQELASHQQKVAGQNVVATPALGNLPTVAVLKGRAAPGLRFVGQGVTPASGIAPSTVAMDTRDKGKGQAGISRSYASVKTSDMRSDVKLSYVPPCKTNGKVHVVLDDSDCVENDLQFSLVG